MSTSPAASAPRQRGFAILIVLWTLILISLIVTSMVALARQETRLAGNLRAAAEASSAADGGVYLAIFHVLGRAPGHWNADGVLHPVAFGGAQLYIRVTSEARKVNLNTAPEQLLTALLHETGMTEENAAAVAANIVAWRSPPDQARAMTAEYRAAGRNYAPPNAPFESVRELAFVLGMPPEAMHRVLPYVTIYHNGDTDSLDAAPVVRRALADVYGTVPVSGKTEPDTSFVSIDVIAKVAGARAARQAIVRIGPLRDGSLYKILDWAEAPAPR